MRQFGVKIFCCLLYCLAWKSAQAGNADSVHIFSCSKVLLKPVLPVAPLHETVAMKSLSMPANFINPGFFCRQEVKLDKKLPMPLRFRLGNMEYSNWLEQKPNSQIPQQ
jgi:hypothetical protein